MESARLPPPPGAQGVTQPPRPPRAPYPALEGFQPGTEPVTWVLSVTRDLIPRGNPAVPGTRVNSKGHLGVQLLVHQARAPC